MLERKEGVTMLKPLAVERPIEILVVEDNPAEARLLQEALREAAVPTHLHLLATGEDALAFLRHEGPHAAVRPDLIVMDLNLPGKSGLEVLAEISADASLRRIPSVVLSGSRAGQDIVKSYELCANCYVLKPSTLEEFLQVAALIKQFWLTAVALPTLCEQL
jgi:chemotaxis family two-component system response regulator Rcp1